MGLIALFIMTGHYLEYILDQALWAPSGLSWALTFILLCYTNYGSYLSANMLAGHILLHLIASFSWKFIAGSLMGLLLAPLPLFFLSLLFGLEIGVAFIQGYVFVLLTCSYIGDAISLHGESSSTPSSTARLGFAQSIKHVEFALWMYSILAHYCQSVPFPIITTCNGKQFHLISFQTRTYFGKEPGEKGIKRRPWILRGRVGKRRQAKTVHFLVRRLTWLFLLKDKGSCINPFSILKDFISFQEHRF